jgi:hypothetical protein
LKNEAGELFTDPDDEVGEVVTWLPPSPGQPTFAPSVISENGLGRIFRNISLLVQMMALPGI